MLFVAQNLIFYLQHRSFFNFLFLFCPAEIHVNTFAFGDSSRGAQKIRTQHKEKPSCCWCDQVWEGQHSKEYCALKTTFVVVGLNWERLHSKTNIVPSKLAKGTRRLHDTNVWVRHTVASRSRRRAYI